MIVTLSEKPVYYICCENKDADQLCSYCTADLHLCYASRIVQYFLKPKFQHSSLLLDNIKAGFGWPVSETPKFGFLTPWLMLSEKTGSQLRTLKILAYSGNFKVLSSLSEHVTNQLTNTILQNSCKPRKKDLIVYRSQYLFQKRLVFLGSVYIDSVDMTSAFKLKLQENGKIRQKYENYWLQFLRSFV